MLEPIARIKTKLQDCAATLYVRRYDFNDWQNMPKTLRQGEIHSSHPLQYYAVIIGGIERHDFPHSKICKAGIFCHTWASTSSVENTHRANLDGSFIIYQKKP